MDILDIALASKMAAKGTGTGTSGGKLYEHKLVFGWSDAQDISDLTLLILGEMLLYRTSDETYTVENMWNLPFDTAKIYAQDFINNTTTLTNMEFHEKNGVKYVTFYIYGTPDYTVEIELDEFMFYDEVKEV
jgi:hypothetical protein